MEDLKGLAKSEQERLTPYVEARDDRQLWLKKNLIKYIKQQEKAKSGDLEDDLSWDLNRPLISWRIWLFCQAFDWKFLPMEGSLLDQPEWLLDDLSTITWQWSIIKEMLDASK